MRPACMRLMAGLLNRWLVALHRRDLPKVTRDSPETKRDAGSAIGQRNSLRLLFRDFLAARNRIGFLTAEYPTKSKFMNRAIFFVSF